MIPNYNTKINNILHKYHKMCLDKMNQEFYILFCIIN